MHDKRVALVTGANQGIGLQIARELAAEGLSVLLGSRNLSQGEVAARALQGEVHAIQLDVTDQASIAAAAERVRREFGRLDVLVNNAAISNTAWSADRSLEDYTSATQASVAPLNEVRAVWETNVFGPLAVFQAMLPLLREAPHASTSEIVRCGLPAQS
jgi:NAD(P)-dependent dehydrogenase (short-subunit alcohol dehydrogenase family)